MNVGFAYFGSQTDLNLLYRSGENSLMKFRLLPSLTKNRPLSLAFSVENFERHTSSLLSVNWSMPATTFELSL